VPACSACWPECAVRRSGRRQRYVKAIIQALENASYAPGTLFAERPRSGSLTM
jgi:hypothetical protein